MNAAMRAIAIPPARALLCCVTVAAAITGAYLSANAATLATMKEVPSCMEFVMNYDGSIADVNNKKWLLGFLSGMAFNTGRDVLKNQTDTAIYHRVFIYCKQYPDAELYEAAEAFFNRSTREIGG